MNDYQHDTITMIIMILTIILQVARVDCGKFIN